MRRVQSAWVVSVASVAIAFVAIAEPIDQPTEGQLALALARKLGQQGQTLTEAQAVEWLSGLGIRPGMGPRAQWSIGAPATTKVVAEIQASVQMLLKDVATGLSIAPPPTLDLLVFELPPAPQKAAFAAEDCRREMPGRTENLPPPPMVPMNNDAGAPRPGPVGDIPAPGAVSSDKPQKILATVQLSSGAAETDDAVVSAILAGNGAEVPVIIELRVPEGGAASPVPLDAASIAAAQDAVLASLKPSDFKLKHKYEFILALAGSISRQGLEKLQRHPAVKAIRLDSIASPVRAPSIAAPVGSVENPRR